MRNPLTIAKQYFDAAFPGWPERWAAYLVAVVALFLVAGSVRSCWA